MAVRFFSEDTSHKICNKRRKASLVKNIVLYEGFRCGDFNIILCSDKYLLGLNQTYLGRDYLTDIITFSYSKGNTINGDLFISFERIFENASDLQVDTDNELTRVIIHGVLHLCGYADSSHEEKELMRQMEDFYLGCPI